MRIGSGTILAISGASLPHRRCLSPSLRSVQRERYRPGKSLVPGVVRVDAVAGVIGRPELKGIGRVSEREVIVDYSIELVRGPDPAIHRLALRFVLRRVHVGSCASVGLLS